MKVAHEAKMAETQGRFHQNLRAFKKEKTKKYNSKLL